MKSPKVIDKKEAVQALAHHHAAFSQRLKLVPRYKLGMAADGVAMRSTGWWNASVRGFNGDVLSRLDGGFAPELSSGSCGWPRSLYSERNFEIGPNRDKLTHR